MFDKRSNILKGFFQTEKTMPLALVLVSGILLVLAFPKISWSFLAWIAFGPLFIALDNKSPRERFKLGYLFGIIYSLGVFYWVTYSMRYYGGLGLLTSCAILLLLVFYLALYTGVFAWLWGAIPPQGLYALLWAPSIWVSLEYARAHLLTGFPWELLGHSQQNNLTVNR